MEIASLGYLGMEVVDVEFWRSTLPPILGLEVGPDGADGSLRLRLDDARYRMALYESKVDRLSYIGWDMRDDENFARATQHLLSQGVDIELPTDAERANRCVRKLLRFQDVFGFHHELFTGLVTAPKEFRPARPVGDFVTGDLGLGHIVLTVPDLAVAVEYYRDVLGFRMTATMRIGHGTEYATEIVFFHVNRRHHTLAVMEMPGYRGLQHLMLQVSDLDDVGIAHEMCREQGIPFTMTLGRHVNDRMLSFYLRTPSGIEIEYGWGGVEIEDPSNWTVSHYEQGEIWGHEYVAEGPSRALEKVD